MCSPVLTWFRIRSHSKLFSMTPSLTPSQQAWFPLMKTEVTSGACVSPDQGYRRPLTPLLLTVAVPAHIPFWKNLPPSSALAWCCMFIPRNTESSDWGGAHEFTLLMLLVGRTHCENHGLTSGMSLGGPVRTR